MSDIIMRIIFAGLATFFISGCAKTVSLNPLYVGPKMPPESTFLPIEFTCIEEYARKKKLYIEKRFVLTPEGGSTMAIDYYDPYGIKPAIIVLPQFEGSDSLGRYFARAFAENNYTALVARSESQSKIDDINLDDFDSVMAKIVMDHRVLIDWLETQNVDVERLGVFGISLGGITATVLSGLDKRVKATVLGICGGDIPYILVHSWEDSIQKVKQRTIQEIKNDSKSMHINEDELYEIFKDKITFDPLDYAEYLDARDVLMILAIFDKVVPRKKGEELRKKIGGPETIYLPTGHYSAFLYIPYIKNKALRFYDARFNQCRQKKSDIGHD